MIGLEAILGAVGAPMTGSGAPSLLGFFLEPLKSNMSSPNRVDVSKLVSSFGMVIGSRAAGGLRVVVVVATALEPPVPEL